MRIQYFHASDTKMYKQRATDIRAQHLKIGRDSLARRGEFRQRQGRPIEDGLLATRLFGFGRRKNNPHLLDFGLSRDDCHLVVLDRQEPIVCRCRDFFPRVGRNSDFTRGEHTQHGFVASEDTDFALGGLGHHHFCLPRPHFGGRGDDSDLEVGHD